MHVSDRRKRRGVASSVSRERENKVAADDDKNVGERSVKKKEARDVTADATGEPRGAMGARQSRRAEGDVGAIHGRSDGYGGSPRAL